METARFKAASEETLGADGDDALEVPQSVGLQVLQEPASLLHSRISSSVFLEKKMYLIMKLQMYICTKDKVISI